MAPSYDALLDLDPFELEHLLASGHAVAPERLAGFRYRGIGLAMPRLVARVAQKFVKVFHQEPGADTVRGWNVRIRQDGLDAPWTPATIAGKRITYGHFEVVAAGTHPRCDHYRDAMVLDYGRLERRLSPFATVRDYVAALAPDDPSLLIGRMYLALGPWRIATPSYFLLVRDVPLDRVEVPPRR